MPQDPITICLLLIPGLPLLAAGLAALCGVIPLPQVKENAHLPVVLAFLCSLGASAKLFYEVRNAQDENPSTAVSSTGFEKVVPLWTWANVPHAYDLKSQFPEDNGPRDFRIEVTLRADALTAMMLVMVTFVSTLVAIFASGYMQGDRGYWRFFAYIGLFVFSMTMLVSVSNFVLLFVFWEAVGVCSYLLIGFWYEKPEAGAAGMKAFLVNRVGDFGFAIALFLIWTTYGTLNFHDDGAISGVLGQSRIATGHYVTGGIATAICLLLLLGACGKSAQFPLHVWLPDAMEGPTPVSALIHAATMVTAGVYMVARCTPLFMASPTAQLVVSCIGGFTALLAGLIALTQFDLKRVLAYSTVSQLGYMFLALGTGMAAGVTSGMFHLFTHAFFKALLFLGAGSVMHAMGGVIDMRQFGGLRKLMPVTHATFLIGCLALAGVFPLAGFWSKDAVLGSVHDKVHQLEHEIEHRSAGNQAATSPHPLPTAASPIASIPDSQLGTFARVYQILYYSGLFTAFLTAFYTFRAYSLTFHGPQRIPAAAGHHAHESPLVMLMPLGILALFAAIIGAVVIIPTGNWGQNLLSQYISHAPSLAGGLVHSTINASPEFHITVAGASTLAAALGIGLALYLYLGERSEVSFLRRVFSLEGSDRLTDPQWVTRLEQVPWIGFITRHLRGWGLGLLVAIVGYILGTITLVFFSAPLILLGNFVSPYKASYNKFYFDELYDILIVTPLLYLARFFYWLDRWLVDGLVNLVGSLPPLAGSLMRSLQMGLVQFYALAMVLGAIVLILARIAWASW
jgi:NADH-quinone oxidoreductase subunit L